MAWQNLVKEEFVEVAKPPHRADIVGNGNVVIELQHSPISPGDIAAREAFYGEMVWLFDATHRFASVNLDDRAFFSLGKTKHLELCKKPVFLDFGFHVVEVSRFTTAIEMVSGYGVARSREWFADTFLSDVHRPGSPAPEPFIPEGDVLYPWERQNPVWKLKHDTLWIDAATGAVRTFPKWTEYIKLNYERWRKGQKHKKWHDYEDVIDRHPEIANGWTKDDIRQMRELLSGTAIILGGLLRVLPAPAKLIRVERRARETKQLLELAEGHIRAGRIPILKDSTKAGLIEKARQWEMQRYGRVEEDEDFIPPFD